MNANGREMGRGREARAEALRRGGEEKCWIMNYEF
jgi:hypothetical protein